MLSVCVKEGPESGRVFPVNVPLSAVRLAEAAFAEAEK